MPDFSVPGWINTLEKYSKYDVDTIVFSHNGNYADPLETGNQDSMRFQLQYVKVKLQFFSQEKLRKVKQNQREFRMINERRVDCAQSQCKNK